MKTIESRLAGLSDLSPAELSTLEDDIRTAFAAADESDDVDAMELAVTQLESLEQFVTAQSDDESEEDADEDSDEDEDADADKDDKDEDTEDDESEEPATDEEPEVTAEVIEEPKVKKTKPVLKEGTVTQLPVDATGSSAEVTAEADNKEETAVAASADFSAPEDRQPIVATAGTRVLVGSDISGYSAGTEFANQGEVATAFVQRLNAIKRSGRGGDGDQMTVATVVASIPEDRMLAPGDIEGNAAKIEKVTGEQAIVASGGYCAPLAVKYDIFGLGSSARPVRDSLPAFGATRGGIRYVAPPKLGDYSGAISLWTAYNDANPGVDPDGVGAQVAGPATKPCLKVNCAAEMTATTDAVTLCLTFGNLMSRAYPELVQRHTQLALIQHARFAELNLLTQIGSQSVAVTSDFKLGVARDFLLAIGKAGAAYRNRHRVARTTPLRVIAPEWVLDAMREDIAQGLPGDRLAEADGIITAYLAARNVNVTWHMDDSFSAQGAGAIVDFPSTIKWYIFAEGTFLFLDGGTLDLGVVRDSGLVATNDYKTFVETFEGVAKIGLESFKVTTTTHVNGSVVGTTAPA